MAGAGAEVRGEGRGGKALPLDNTGASEGLEQRGDIGLNRILPPELACRVEKRLWLGQRGPRREVGAQGGPRLGGGRGPARGLHLGKVSRQDLQTDWMRGRERDNHIQLREAGHELVRNLLWAESARRAVCSHGTCLAWRHPQKGLPGSNLQVVACLSARGQVPLPGPPRTARWPTGYCELPSHPWPGVQGGAGPTAGGERGVFLSGEKHEGQKAEASVFFRKEIFAAVTVWESRLGPAVRPSQEAPLPRLRVRGKQF